MEKTMKLKRTVNKKGYIKVEIKIKGEWINIEKGCFLSRCLTGTDSERSSGVFISKGKENFTFGVYKKEFEFVDSLDMNVLSASKMAKILLARVSEVRDWVTECKAIAITEEVCVTITP